MSKQYQLPAFHRGDTRTYKLTFKDSAGAVINVSGHTLWLTLKGRTEDADPGVLQKKVVLPSDATSVSGVGSITLTSAETGALAPGNYFYDIQWSQPGTPPSVTTLIYGTVAILPDVTRGTV